MIIEHEMIAHEYCRRVRETSGMQFSVRYKALGGAMIELYLGSPG